MKKNKVIIFISAIIVVILLVLGGYFIYNKFNNNEFKIKDEKVISDISKKIDKLLWCFDNASHIDNNITSCETFEIGIMDVLDNKLTIAIDSAKQSTKKYTDDYGVISELPFVSREAFIDSYNSLFGVLKDEYPEIIKSRYFCDNWHFDKETDGFYRINDSADVCGSDTTYLNKYKFTQKNSFVYAYVYIGIGQSETDIVTKMKTNPELFEQYRLTFKKDIDGKYKFTNVEIVK